MEKEEEYRGRTYSNRTTGPNEGFVWLHCSTIVSKCYGKNYSKVEDFYTPTFCFNQSWPEEEAASCSMDKLAINSFRKMRKQRTLRLLLSQKMKRCVMFFAGIWYKVWRTDAKCLLSFSQCFNCISVYSLCW